MGCSRRTDSRTELILAGTIALAAILLIVWSVVKRSFRTIHFCQHVTESICH